MFAVNRIKLLGMLLLAFVTISHAAYAEGSNCALKSIFPSALFTEEELARICVIGPNCDLEGFPSYSADVDSCPKSGHEDGQGVLKKADDDPLEFWRQKALQDAGIKEAKEIDHRTSSEKKDNVFDLLDEKLQNPENIERFKKEIIKPVSDDNIPATLMFQAFTKAILPDVVLFKEIRRNRLWLTRFDKTNPLHIENFKNRNMPLPERLFRWRMDRPITVSVSVIGKGIDEEISHTIRSEIAGVFPDLRNFVKKATGLTLELSEEADGDIVIYHIIKVGTQCTTQGRSASDIKEEELQAVSVDLENPSYKKKGNSAPFSIGSVFLNSDYTVKKVSCDTGSHYFWAFKENYKGGIADTAVACVVRGLGVPGLNPSLNKTALETVFLRGLYSPKLAPGMTADEIKASLPEVWEDLQKQ